MLVSAIKIDVEQRFANAAQLAAVAQEWVHTNEWITVERVEVRTHSCVQCDYYTLVLHMHGARELDALRCEALVRNVSADFADYVNLGAH